MFRGHGNPPLGDRTMSAGVKSHCWIALELSVGRECPRPVAGGVSNEEGPVGHQRETGRSEQLSPDAACLRASRHGGYPFPAAFDTPDRPRRSDEDEHGAVEATAIPPGRPRKANPSSAPTASAATAPSANSICATGICRSTTRTVIVPSLSMPPAPPPLTLMPIISLRSLEKLEKT